MKKLSSSGSLLLLLGFVLVLWYWSVQRKHADLIGVNEFTTASVVNTDAPDTEPAAPQFPLPSGTPDDIVLLYDEAREGIGIAAYPGSAVVAILPGTVVRIREGTDSDGQLWLRNPDGLLFHYDHLQRIVAREGARVPAGHIIGTVGYEGLFFSVRDGEGRAVDPLMMFASDTQP